MQYKHASLWQTAKWSVIPRPILDIRNHVVCCPPQMSKFMDWLHHLKVMQPWQIPSSKDYFTKVSKRLGKCWANRALVVSEWRRGGNMVTRTAGAVCVFLKKQSRAVEIAVQHLKWSLHATDSLAGKHAVTHRTVETPLADVSLCYFLLACQGKDCSPPEAENGGKLGVFSELAGAWCPNRQFQSRTGNGLSGATCFK